MTFTRRHRWVLLSLCAGLAGVLILQALQGGVADPTGGRLSARAAAFNSGLLVFREGLESVLVLAAITAGFRGANQRLRRPITIGVAAALAATVLTWFAAVWLIGHVSARALDVQAATGLVAIVVLLVITNWFFHRIYWTGWISHHNQAKKRLLASATPRAVYGGLIALGFASVYREGFEIVLFLQNMRIAYGERVILPGIALASALVAIVAGITFLNHRRLPYKRMLVVTGVMLGVVLVVMVGEQVQEMQQAGWIGTTPVGIALPGWLGVWFATFPNLEGLVAQAAAGGFVLASYFIAGELRVRRPKRHAASAEAARMVGEPAPAQPRTLTI
ncbi:MAG TPA: FTR1 family protein [Gaiellales bacterium]|jgi:high-affinity iron transporter|nr:FTR1 family protein [Gaiellales bacterium]